MESMSVAPSLLPGPCQYGLGAWGKRPTCLCLRAGLTSGLGTEDRALLLPALCLGHWRGSLGCQRSQLVIPEGS